MILTLAPELPLETQLGCFGYFGFASGVALALFPRADDHAGLYCQRDKCPRAAACWDRHRARVRTLLPALCELSDEVSKTHQGPAYMLEFHRRVQEENPDQPKDKAVEPYVVVMMGNLQDGAEVATAGRPTNRGDSSLTWPLTPLEPCA